MAQESVTLRVGEEVMIASGRIKMVLRAVKGGFQLRGYRSKTKFSFSKRIAAGTTRGIIRASSFWVGYAKSVLGDVPILKDL